MARRLATRRITTFSSRSMPTPWRPGLAGSLWETTAHATLPSSAPHRGKTLKGSRRLDAKPLHVLSAFIAELGAVVGDLVVEPDQNEIVAAMALIKELPLDGAVITGDAIFCQREICRHIRDANGHYLFVVKDNQPELKANIAESFGDLSPLRSRRGGARGRVGRAA